MTLDDLHNARRAGKRPDEVIVLALAPPRREIVPETVPVIELPDVPIDLRCVVGLDIVLAGVTDQAERLVELAERCSRYMPRQLEIWLLDRPRYAAWISVRSLYAPLLREVPPQW